MHKKVIWISWEIHRRNRSLSKELGVKLFELNYSDKFFLFRYVLSIFQTISLIKKERPTVLIVQNPSIILSLLTVILKVLNIFRYRLIVDCHNAGLFPETKPACFFKKLIKYIIKFSDHCIVSNKYLARHILGCKGNPLIAEDPLPTFDSIPETRKLNGVINFLFICTFSDDEPYLEVIEAVKLLYNNIHVYISGKPKVGSRNILPNLPSNLTLTGFMPSNVFLEVLFSVDSVIDLTKREACLVCGAYEAVSAEKPLILSDTQALREYFTAGTVFAENNKHDIARAINEMVSNLSKYNQEISLLKVDLKNRWQNRKTELTRAIYT